VLPLRGKAAATRANGSSRMTRFAFGIRRNLKSPVAFPQEREREAVFKAACSRWRLQWSGCNGAAAMERLQWSGCNGAAAEGLANQRLLWQVVVTGHLLRYSYRAYTTTTTEKGFRYFCAMHGRQRASRQTPPAHALPFQLQMCESPLLRCCNYY
jgi:hypothetical protein